MASDCSEALDDTLRIGARGFGGLLANIGASSWLSPFGGVGPGMSALNGRFRGGAQVKLLAYYKYTK